MKKVLKEVYVSKDGKEFLTEEDCVKYEDKHDSILEKERTIKNYKKFLEDHQINNIDRDSNILNDYPLMAMDNGYNYYFLKNGKELEEFFKAIYEVYSKYYTGDYDGLIKRLEEKATVKYPLFLAYNRFHMDLVYESDIVDKIDALTDHLNNIYREIEIQFGYKFDYEK